MNPEPQEYQCLRWSLVFVWLATACASVWELDGQSSALLASAGIHDAIWMRVLVLGGAATDLALGLAMAFLPSRLVYLAALGAMLLMTIAAILLVPALWLHPLGPLTKNLPIAAALLLLAKRPA
ncbi:MAG: DoxX-like family protein [Rhodoferax sp.]|uniref:DoxX-like family protein n=1 Tax=Rhodoferax sp. TaxID=50421 RepID=UPI003267C880